jgi:hypothetical protein
MIVELIEIERKLIESIESLSSQGKCFGTRQLKLDKP